MGFSYGVLIKNPIFYNMWDKLGDYSPNLLNLSINCLTIVYGQLKLIYEYFFLILFLYLLLCYDNNLFKLFCM